MKRHYPQSMDNKLTAFCGVSEIPSDIQSYVEELRLLNYVPLSYIIADESLLPPESLRFFCVDRNWVSALTDGALSIGRVTEGDGKHDEIQLGCAMEHSNARLHLPRLKKMHPLHLGSALNVYKENEKFSQAFLTDRSDSGEFSVNDAATNGMVSGFIMRSELVRRAKDLNISAYSGKKEIPALRLDSLADDISIGLFDGRITSLKISEPKTGLSFGLAGKEECLVPKDTDEKNFGAPLRDKSIDIKDYKNGAGRLDVSKLAEKLGESLNTDIKSAKLAFELIVTPACAVFKEKEE